MLGRLILRVSFPQYPVLRSLCLRGGTGRKQAADMEVWFELKERNFLQLLFSCLLFCQFFFFFSELVRNCQDEVSCVLGPALMWMPGTSRPLLLWLSVLLDLDVGVWIHFN